MVLQTLEKIEAAVKQRPEELANERAKGTKVVGWLNYNVPEEIIYALGLIPIRLGTGGNDKLVELGSRYISTKNCVFTREAVGLFAQNTDPYIKNSDIVAVDGTCLQIYRVAELIKYFFKVHTVILGVPRNFYLPEAKNYFEGELTRFVQELENLSGKKLDEKKLEESIKLFNEIRKSIKILYKHQAADNSPISWREVFQVVYAGFYLDRQKYLSLLKELISEIKEKQEHLVIEKTKGKPRIFVSGSIIPPGDTKLIGIIEQLGGRIVGDDLWSGLNSSLNVDIKEPTVNGIADAYLNRVPHAALPYLDLATDKRLENLKQLIHDFKAQGVIYHSLRYCDPFTFKAVETKNVLRQEGIPLLEIHTEYAGSDYEAIRTRVEAFIEMLKLGKAQEVVA